MGLAVEAFSFIQPKTNKLKIEWDVYDEYSEYGLIYDKYFQIELITDYERPRLLPLGEGDYELTDRSDKYWFSLGYSTHGKWHGLFANYAEDLWTNGWGEIKPDEPFYFQFEFPVIEGVFGTYACRKLTKDYSEYQDYLFDKANKFDKSGAFEQYYYYFKKAFYIGSQEGVVFLC